MDGLDSTATANANAAGPPVNATGPPTKDELRCHLAMNKDATFHGARRLWFVIVVCILFMVGEVVGGLLANSLTILMDAAHMLTDMSGFIIALVVGYYAIRESKASHSFGYHRVEVLGGLVSIFIIWLLTGVLLYEAVLRFIRPQAVDGKLMFILAVVGLVVNIFILYVFGHNHEHEGQGHSHGESLSMRAAWLHALGDTIQSVGVLIASIIIWAKPEWHVVDPICTLSFGILVLFTTCKILRDIVDTIMERVPRNMCVDSLSASLLAVPGVSEVHDLHVWCIKPGTVLMTVHVVVLPEANAHEVNKLVTSVCQQAGIGHTTVQVVSSEDDCPCRVPLIAVGVTEPQ